MFNSKKVYSNNAYVELGLKRIEEYYTNTNTMSFPDIMEQSIIIIDSIITRHIEEYGYVPEDLVLDKINMINEDLEQLDKIYIKFLGLIDKYAENNSHKKELTYLLNQYDIKAMNKIKRYLL